MIPLRKIRKIPEHVRALGLRLLSEGLGLDVSLGTQDRRVLEQRILPYFASDDRCRRILFVGCDWYTRHYGRRFAGREYWTIEMDPARAQYGEAGRHVVDALANLSAHFPAGHFDVIVCNGVLGWGLNDRDEAERSLAACRHALADGGVLVLGWNDIPEKRVLVPAQSESLSSLARWTFPLLGVSEYVTATRNRHTFSFFVKAAAR
jgi:hypothetical protein